MTSFLLAFTGAFLSSAVLELTKRWHMKFSSDYLNGAQKIRGPATPRADGLAMAPGRMGTPGSEAQTLALLGPVLWTMQAPHGAAKPSRLPSQSPGNAKA